jgi:cyanophycinase
MDMFNFPNRGPIALVGAGEYLPEMSAIDASLLEGRPPRFVQLATAATKDGPDVVQHWHELGAAQAQRLGVEQVIIPVANRQDANQESFADAIAGAGLIYLSGGDPDYLCGTLSKTKVWQTIITAWLGGAALAGCSAGALAIGSWVPSIDDPSTGVPGLGLLDHVVLIPHFNRLPEFQPDFEAKLKLPRKRGLSLIGVDEFTAIVGGPTEWSVMGQGSAWLLSSAQRNEFVSGAKFSLPGETNQAG